MAPTPVLSGGPPIAPCARSLLHALEQRAARDEPWLVFHHGSTVESFSAAQILQRAQGWTQGFAAAGVGRWQRVGIWQPNSVDFVAAFFGALGVGAVPVPLAWPVMEGNFEAALGHLEPIRARARIRFVAAPERAQVATVGVDWVSPRDAHQGWIHRPGAEDTAFLQFTSGSTGQPRGVVISHLAALHNAHALVAGLGLTPADIGVAWIPFFHDMGLIGVLLASLVGGFSVHVLRPGEFLLHPWRWLELIGEAGASLTVGPDFGYAFAARRCGTRRFSLGSLRCALSGSEPIHLATLEAFEARFGPDGFRPEAFVGAYGLAENTLGVSVGPAHGRLYRDPRGRLTPTVGTPLPGVEIALDGPDGEICVRSQCLMKGYFEASEESKRALVDGWLRTGDLGVVEGGKLFITGREKDLVIKAGAKFHPSEIEQLVAGSLDAPPNGVAAFNDADQLVLVIEQRRIEPAPDSSRVRALIVERLGVRVDRVRWVPAGSLPRTSSGKLRRTACAEMFGEL